MATSATSEDLLNFWKQQFKFTDRQMKAFAAVRREYFIPQAIKHQAYEDRPLPLLRGKTISQPTTVMIMTAGLELQEGENVFEIGTGSGYQAAILAELVGPMGRVTTTEVIPELVQFSKANLRRADLHNVTVLEEDGSQGYEKHAPFDKIIITAACKQFPPKLLDQLKEGGIIIGPIGTQDSQQMVRGIKEKSGRVGIEVLGSFIFTPMYGKYGFIV